MRITATKGANEMWKKKENDTLSQAIFRSCHSVWRALKVYALSPVKQNNNL